MQRFALTLAALGALAAGPALAAQPALPNAMEAGQDLAAFREARVNGMMRMDTDGDGRLSQAELSALREAGKQGGAKARGGRGAKMFGRLDANHDGYLSRDELGRLAEMRFRKLDTNGDGKVVASERQAAQSGRGRGMGDAPGL